jgi:hypothetical protein
VPAGKFSEKNMKKINFFASLKSLKNGVGSGVGSKPFSQRYRSSNPDPHQNLCQKENPDLGSCFFSFFPAALLSIWGFQAGRSSSRLGAAAAANLTTSCAWLLFTGIDAGIKIAHQTQ